MSVSAATAMNSDLCAPSQRTGRTTALTPLERALVNRRPICCLHSTRLTISMPSPPSEPCDPPNYQCRDADAERVQQQDLSAPGERQRPEQQQRHRHDRHRHSIAPNCGPDDPCDSFPNLHVFTSLIAVPARHPKRKEPCVDWTCAQPRSTDAIERGRVENASTATGETRDGLRGKRTQIGLGVMGKRQGSATGEVRIDRVPNAGRKCLGKVTSLASGGKFGLGSCV